MVYIHAIISESDTIRFCDSQSEFTTIAISDKEAQRKPEFHIDAHSNSFETISATTGYSGFTMSFVKVSGLYHVARDRNLIPAPACETVTSPKVWLYHVRALLIQQEPHTNDEIENINWQIKTLLKLRKLLQHRIDQYVCTSLCH